MVPAHDHGRAIHQETATCVDTASAVHDVTDRKDGVDPLPTDEIEYGCKRLVLRVDIAKHGEASRGHGRISALRPLIDAQYDGLLPRGAPPALDDVSLCQSLFPETSAYEGAV
jgi:hypothetical protein